MKYINKDNLLIISLILTLTAFTVLSLAIITYKPTEIVKAYEDTNKPKLEFWSNFLSIYPTYFQGWIELTNIYISKGELGLAIDAYNKAYNINPNSEKLILLRLKLGIKE